MHLFILNEFVLECNNGRIIYETKDIISHNFLVFFGKKDFLSLCQSMIGIYILDSGITENENCVCVE